MKIVQILRFSSSGFNFDESLSRQPSKYQVLKLMVRIWLRSIFIHFTHVITYVQSNLVWNKLSLS